MRKAEVLNARICFFTQHDAYGAGDAGTALSAAIGMAVARDLAGGDSHVVAVAGDDAFTFGPTLEALNNIAESTRIFIVVLNDNEWSIDKNVNPLFPTPGLAFQGILRAG